MFKALQFLFTQQPIFWLLLAGSSFCVGLSVARWTRLSEAERLRLRSGPSRMRIRSDQRDSSPAASRVVETRQGPWYAKDDATRLPKPKTENNVIDGLAITTAEPKLSAQFSDGSNTPAKSGAATTPREIDGLFSDSYPSGPG